MVNIGAHVSAAGGIWKSIENAHALGVTSMQIFGASPRQYGVKVPSAEDVEKYRALLKKSPLKNVFLHAAYLANLASPEARTRALSIKNLAGHLRIAEMIGADGLIFHIGSGKDTPKEQAMQWVVEGMKKVLHDAPGKAKLILENAAGGGAKIGADAADIGWLLKKANDERLAVCFDTAHAFEAGVIEYTPEKIKAYVDMFDRVVGMKYVAVIHANDSKTAFGSHNDRHDNIGEGYIGLQGFKNLVKENRVRNLPWILEVPGFSNEGPDKKNVELLRGCFR